MKKQVVVIHGGHAFKAYGEFLNYLKNKKINTEYFLYKKGWKNELAIRLGKNYEVLLPQMPNKQNAKYKEWKIWFERMVPFLRDGVVLIGHSMGGIFLAKYLSENKLSKRINTLVLVSAPCKKTNRIKFVREFRLKGNLQKVWEQCRNIHIFHSVDDPVVPVAEADEYKKAWPKAKLHLFTDRGHFNQETFPELAEEIKKAEK
ncbi:MAG: alpha/beta hydrolase [Candidatus Moranbacteria bacterium]|nr:alpha/beta hydrolase [Candidatus Moranbacteria bacterium]